MSRFTDAELRKMYPRDSIAVARQRAAKATQRGIEAGHSVQAAWPKQAKPKKVKGPDSLSRKSSKKLRAPIGNSIFALGGAT